MATNAFAGMGTIFKRNGVELGEINSISGPNKTRDTIDATTLSSINGYKEFLGGFRDGGEVGLNLNFTKGGYVKFNSDFESDTLQSYTIVLSDPSSSTFDFDAFVTNLTMSVQPSDKVTGEVTLKISGPVTLTS